MRRCTAEIARVDAGATVGIATTSGGSAGRPRRGTNATPNPARTNSMWFSNSIDSCTMRGAFGTPSNSRRSHCRQMVESKVAIQS